MELVNFPSKEESRPSAIESLKAVIEYLEEVKDEEGIEYEEITVRASNDTSSAMFTTQRFQDAILDAVFLQDHFLSCLKEKP